MAFCWRIQRVLHRARASLGCELSPRLGERISVTAAPDRGSRRGAGELWLVRLRRADCIEGGLAVNKVSFSAIEGMLASVIILFAWATIPTPPVRNGTCPRLGHFPAANNRGSSHRYINLAPNARSDPYWI